MTLEQAYFPWMSGGILIAIALILINGWYTGFLRRFISLVSWAASLLLGWWIAFVFGGVSFSSLTSLDAVQQMFLSRIIVFVLASVVIRIITGVLLGLTGLLRKISVIRLADHIGGLVLSVIVSYIGVSLLTLFLQTGIITNGPEYVESSALHVVARVNDQLLSSAMKGELDIDEIRSILSQGTE